MAAEVKDFLNKVAIRMGPEKYNYYYNKLIAEKLVANYNIIGRLK